MKVGIIQMAVSADKQTNLDRASQHIRDAAGRGADLVILGEMFCCPYENAAFTAKRRDAGGALHRLSQPGRPGKNGVYLVNTSRGALIDTDALIDGLVDGKFGGVGLDVYEEEEGIFYEDKSNEIMRDENLARLMTFPNVLITSHMGFSQRRLCRRLQRSLWKTLMHWKMVCLWLTA